MPRTLPWLVDHTSPKKDSKRSPAPRKSRARSSSPSDLVNSDLDIVSGHVIPEVKAKQYRDRSPSTSPVRATAPEVELMREGLNADDVFMMVEDEFDATARLFTQHIHHAEYVRLKRLHRSRGADTLAKLGHGTDATTQQSRAMKMQIEAQENSKKRKSTGTDESESEDEYLDDPMLARLMMEDRNPSSRRLLSRLGKAKSNTRAAAGYSQSPRTGNKTKDVFANMQRSGLPQMSSITEDEETGDEDFDAGAPKSRHSAAYRDIDSELNRARESIENNTPSKPQRMGFFKAFNEKSRQEKSSATRLPDRANGNNLSTLRDTESTRESRSTPAVKDSRSTYSGRTGKSSNVAEILARRRGTAQQPESGSAILPKTEPRVKEEPSSPAPKRPTTVISSKTFGTQSSRTGEILARGKIEPVKIKEVKPKSKAKLDDIPTFLF